jgi:RNA-directed DNA polymerase
LVVLCRSRQEAAEALAAVRDWTAQAGLTLHAVKTKLVHAWGDGFDVLGYHFLAAQDAQEEPGKAQGHDPGRPSGTVGRGLTRVIADVNPTLRGWYGYFQHSCHPTFGMIDGRVRRRLKSIL